LCAGLELILGKLAVIEAQQRQHTRLFQQLLGAQSHESAEDVELPEGIHLPLDTVDSMDTLEDKLQDREVASLMVCFISVYSLGLLRDSTTLNMEHPSFAFLSSLAFPLPLSHQSLDPTPLLNPLWLSGP